MDDGVKGMGKRDSFKKPPFDIRPPFHRSFAFAGLFSLIRRTVSLQIRRYDLPERGYLKWRRPAFKRAINSGKKINLFTFSSKWQWTRTKFDYSLFHLRYIRHYRCRWWLMEHVLVRLLWHFSCLSGTIDRQQQPLHRWWIKPTKFLFSQSLEQTNLASTRSFVLDWKFPA